MIGITMDTFQSLIKNAANAALLYWSVIKPLKKHTRF